MSIFGSILGKIFSHSSGSAAAAAPGTSGTPPAAPSPAAATPQAAPAAGAAAAPTQLGDADVEAILVEIAAQKGGGGNWKVSIVDLLRLLDLDSSLNARKELAEELNVHAGEHGSAEQNIALSKAVWQQLAKNGGKVPDSLKG